MSMHRADYVQFAKDHPILAAIVITIIATSIIAALFWNAVL